LLLQVTLTPSEGKRLIGMAVAQMEVVQNALREGTIVIATSTSTAYVLEELLENSVLDLLAPAGTLVVEHRGDPPLVPGGRRPDREKTFGDTILSLWMGI